ncbi:hypothetical protein [Polaromonas sp. AER18D-145]|uniref:hypothetical protein n=1 Tax=Polaromonas sp. AER18D-145 TaxID=1977060 RepID=UPI000BBC21BA|nr:hypothetical protein [Polaromonas sp. AER18D-145]
MSLIVARMVGQKIHILGDTALTYCHKLGANALIEGCLKQYRIGDHLAVAFAGDALIFESLCEKILACASTAEVVEVVLRNLDKAMGLDLLVCEIGKDNITFIKQGCVTTALAGFIGDSLAYDGFQSAYHSGELQPQGLPNSGQAQFLRIPEPVDDEDIYPQLFNALKVVVDDPSIPSVGGAIVPLCTDKGKFRYINYAGSSLFARTPISDTPQPMDFGTAQLGGHSFDFGDDEPRGGQGNEIGFYLLQAGFGVIFPANSVGFRRAELLKAESPPLWVLNTTKRLGFGIASCFISPHHCGIAGEKFLQAENWISALFCFELGDVQQLIKEQPKLADRYIAAHAVALSNLGRPEDAIRLLDIEIVRSGSSTFCKEIRESVRQHYGI